MSPSHSLMNMLLTSCSNHLYKLYNVYITLHMFSPFTNQTADNTTEKSFLKITCYTISTAQTLNIEKKNLYLKKREKKKKEFSSPVRFVKLDKYCGLFLKECIIVLNGPSAWFGYEIREKEKHIGKLNGELVPDDFATFHFHLLVKPLPVTAALNATPARSTFRARVEAAHAVHIQTVTQVLAIGEQSPFVVVHFVFGSNILPAWFKQTMSYRTVASGFL